MTEFAFDGGYRGPGPSWEEHKFDRDTGRPRLGQADLPSGSDSWQDRQLLPKVTVTRLETSLEGNPGTGLCGVIHGNGIEGIKRQIFDLWGGGGYKLQYPAASGPMSVVPGAGRVATIHVPGVSKPILRTVEPVEPSQSLPPELQELTPEDTTPETEDSSLVPFHAGPLPVTVGCLVWLELSKQGPFKVVAKYDHVLGASVAAHYPNTAKNEYERVRVAADLFWLCQDSVGQVHILAAGSLTTAPPSSALKGAGQRLASAGAWAWSKREVVLWASLAVAGSKALGVF